MSLTNQQLALIHIAFAAIHVFFDGGMASGLGLLQIVRHDMMRQIDRKRNTRG